MALFFPGTMDHDSRTIAAMAATGELTDWFSPLFIWLWGIIDRVAPAPGSLWVLQTALLLTGGWMLSEAVAQRFGPRVAMPVVACFLLPPFAYLFHEMSKDTFMAAGLICLVGILSRLAARSGFRNPALLLAGLLGLVALGARHDAVFAVAPLVLAIIRLATPGRTLRSLMFGAAFLAILVAGLRTFTYGVLQPRWRPAVTNLIAFDLVGMSRFAGTAVLPASADTILLAGCFQPAPFTIPRDNCRGLERFVWDTYLSDPGRMRADWLRSIAGNAPAYVGHRAIYAANLFRIRCPTCENRGVPLSEAMFNPADQPVRSPALALTVERAANRFFDVAGAWSAVLVLGVVGWLAFRRRGADRWSVVVAGVCASAICHAVALAFIGVDTDFRYTYWWYAAAFLAAALAPTVLLRTGTSRGSPTATAFR